MRCAKSAAKCHCTPHGRPRTLGQDRANATRLAGGPDLDPGTLLQGPAALEVRDGGGELLQLRQGILASVEARALPGEPPLFQVRLVPRLWRLSLQREPRAHLGRTWPDLLAELLGEAGVPYGFQGQVPALPELACRHRESALDFLHRWCARLGLVYTFRQDPAGETVLPSGERAFPPADRLPVPGP